MYYNVSVHLLYAYPLLLCTQFLLVYTEVESLYIQAHKIAGIGIYCKPVPTPFCSIDAVVFTYAFCPHKVILDQEMDSIIDSRIL